MKGKIKIKNSIKRFKVIFGLVCLVSLYILGKAMKTMLPPMSDYWEAVDDRFVRIFLSKPIVVTCFPTMAECCPRLCPSIAFTLTCACRTVTVGSVP